MKIWILILFLGLPPAFSSNAARLYAQHGHGGAGLGLSGAGQASAGRSEAPGRDAANDAGNGSIRSQSAPSSVMASKNPGVVLDHNGQLASKLEGLLGLSGPNALIALKADAAGV